MTVQIVGYILLLKLLIFTIQKFPLVSKLPAFFREMIACDFCFGCWVYIAGNVLFKIDIFIIEILPIIVVRVLSGIAVSFLMHLISEGWKAKFQILNFE